VNLHELPERLKKIEASEKFEFLKKADELVWTRLKNLERQMKEVRERCNEAPQIQSKFERLWDNLDSLVFNWLYIFYSFYFRNDPRELADEMASVIKNLSELEKEWQQFLKSYSVGIIFV